VGRTLSALIILLTIAPTSLRAQRLEHVPRAFPQTSFETPPLRDHLLAAPSSTLPPLFVAQQESASQPCRPSKRFRLIAGGAVTALGSGMFFATRTDEANPEIRLTGAVLAATGVILMIDTLLSC